MQLEICSASQLVSVLQVVMAGATDDNQRNFLIGEFRRAVGMTEVESDEAIVLLMREIKHLRQSLTELRNRADSVKLECDTCLERDTCEFVDDPYNTVGYCLARK